MLDSVDLKARFSKAEYREKMAALDVRLAQLQRDLRAANIPVVIVFEGWDTAGKGSVLSRLLQPLDPRGFKVHHIAPPSEEERLWPPMWRFWNKLPADGAIGIFNHSWYRQVVDERVEEGMSDNALAMAFEGIRVFERQLTEGGVVMVKFFLHISKKEQAKRFDTIRKDPVFAWKVGKAERRRHKRYDDYCKAIEEMLQETDCPGTPWTVVAATDERRAVSTVAQTLVEAFEHALAERAQGKQSTPELAPRSSNPLAQVDVSLTFPREEYEKRLPELQKELRRLQHLCYVHRRPVVIVYEGWDAAGKGGNIRRLTRELDPRGYEVIPVAAPNSVERAHHYLWRFWRALPKAGHFTIYDRSWYGRVMVERIECFAKPHEWMRAFSEINEFEAQLADFGTVIVKFWLHISKDEQLRRFESRQQIAEKQWKITDEDWRNRDRWDDYWEAVSDMLDRTSTAYAPWTIVEGNDKCHARIKTLQTLITRLLDVV